jgi:hypothetical protein
MQLADLTFHLRVNVIANPLMESPQFAAFAEY